MCWCVCMCPLTLDVGPGRGGTVVLEVIQDARVPGETQQDLNSEKRGSVMRRRPVTV